MAPVPKDHSKDVGVPIRGCDCTPQAIGPLFTLVCLLTIAFVVKYIFIRKQKRHLKPDSILTYISFACCFALLVHGIAISFYGVANDEFLEDQGLVKVSFSAVRPFEAIYLVAMLTIKLALLILYFRAFTNDRLSFFKRLQGPLGWVFVVNVIVILFWTFATWSCFAEKWKGFNNDTWNYVDISVGYMNMGADLFLLLLPIVGTCRLQLTRKQKHGVVCIVLLGTLATAASLARALQAQISTILTLRYPFSTGQQMVVTIVTLSLESTLGFLCFCIPAFHDVIIKSGLAWSWFCAVEDSWRRYVWPGVAWRGRKVDSGSDGLWQQEDSQVQLIVRT